MTLKIALCDDNTDTLDFLYSTLWNYQIATDVNLTIDKYTNPKELLNAYKEPGAYHIILLDIEMPEMNGIKVAEIIRKMKDRQVIIVFISNFPQYMQDSFAVHPFHYFTEYNFYLCRRGILLNLQHVHYFDKNNIVLDNGKNIPVSRTNFKKLKDLYINRVVIFRNNLL